MTAADLFADIRRAIAGKSGLIRDESLAFEDVRELLRRIDDIEAAARLLDGVTHEDRDNG